MGKEIGQKCMTSGGVPNAQYRIVSRLETSLVVLAFFSVVASSPNLSTFYFRLQSYEEKTEGENIWC